MTLNPIKAVLFDMDETLIRHTATPVELGQATYEAFAEALAPIEAADFLRMVWHKANDLWFMMIDGAVSGEVARPYTFINALRALKADESLAVPLMNDLEQRILDSTRLDDDTRPLLDELRKADYTLGIVTNGYTTLQTRKLERHGLLDLVDFALVSESVGAHKPDPRIFEEALLRASVSASEALFVGDNLETDIAGAVQAGLEAILIDPSGERAEALRNDPEADQPHHIITSLDGLRAILGLGPLASP